jgi:hypothetical protein
MTPKDSPAPVLEFPRLHGALHRFERPRGVTDLPPAPETPVQPTMLRSMPGIGFDLDEAMVDRPRGAAIEGSLIDPLAATPVEAAGGDSDATRVFRTVAADALHATPTPTPEAAPGHPATPSMVDAIVHGTSFVIPDQPPAGAEARGLGPADPQLASLASRPLRELTPDELTLLIDKLSLRDTAREAFRARLISWASAQRQRSAYEIVFLMLAASIMVLLCGPTLIGIARALHGHAA